jgi:hypothetical protein
VTTTSGSGSKDIAFTYTVAEEFEDAHNIVKLIDSAENTYVENTYDENDRVATQVYGNGTISYDYETDEDNKIINNTVTDRL